MPLEYFSKATPIEPGKNSSNIDENWQADTTSGSKIQVVMDNLNTHITKLIAQLGPKARRALWKRLKWHNHRSMQAGWTHAETAIGIFIGQYLVEQDFRILKFKNKKQTPGTQKLMKTDYSTGRLRKIARRKMGYQIGQFIASEH